MKHLKTFENFSLNENNEQDMEESLSSKINSLSDSEMEEVKSSLVELADNLGLSPEDLTDKKKVEAALSKWIGDINDDFESGLKLESMEVNEGFKDWWMRVKNKFYKFLTKFGIGGLLSGMITFGIGINMQSTATSLADYSGQDVMPSSLIIISGAAIAISLIATFVGLVGAYNTSGESKKPSHRYRVGGGAPL
jgi:hypothetical protein